METTSLPTILGSVPYWVWIGLVAALAVVLNVAQQHRARAAARREAALRQAETAWRLAGRQGPNPREARPRPRHLFPDG